MWCEDFRQGIVKLFELCLHDEVDKIDRLDMKRIVEEKKNMLAWKAQWFMWRYLISMKGNRTFWERGGSEMFIK